MADAMQTQLDVDSLFGEITGESKNDNGSDSSTSIVGYRVVTVNVTHRKRELDPGPWHPTRQPAEMWLSILQRSGYRCYIEVLELTTFSAAETDRRRKAGIGGSTEWKVSKE